MRNQQGFTLIELMIVVAIIGILAAIAIPAYQDYTVRAKVTELLSVADGAKTAVAEFYQTNGQFPTDTSAAGYSSPTTKYVSSVAISGGKITVTAQSIPQLNGNVDLTLTAASSPNNGPLVWTCGSTSDGTTIPKKYLPSSCRG